MLKFFQLKPTKNILQALHDLIEHDGIEHAGYIAFLIMLGIFPFIFLFGGIINIVNHLIQKDLYEAFISLLLNSNWSSLISALKPRLFEITHSPPQSLLTLAVLSAIWTSSSMFQGLKTVLNRAYRVQKVPSYLLGRMYSIVEFVVVVCCLGIIVIFITIIPEIIAFINIYIISLEQISIYAKNWNESILQDLVQYSIGALILIYIHCFLPHKKHKIKEIMPGVIITLCGWSICTSALKYYIKSFSQISLIYGGVAGIVVALFYFYVCSIVLIYGAEFNYHHIQKAKKEHKLIKNRLFF